MLLCGDNRVVFFLNVVTAKGHEVMYKIKYPGFSLKSSGIAVTIFLKCHDIEHESPVHATLNIVNSCQHYFF